MPLWHNDYFELIIFEKLQAQEKLQKSSRIYHFTFRREISICKGVSFSVPERGGWLNLYKVLSPVKTLT